MGKRSDFKRRKADSYPTPEAAVLPLLPFLEKGTRFIEPCVGRGHLVKHLEKHGHKCVDASDSERDFRTTKYGSYKNSVFITNPPWTRELLHPAILNLSSQKPTWLLLDADWMHTRQAAPYLKYCRAIVSIGRVKWIPNSPFTGKDNCCWYHFINTESRIGPEFYGRAE